MNMKSGKKMGGFMCRSPASTAVCMTGDSRSVIVPRRPDCRSTCVVDHSSMLMDTKYSRLVQTRRLSLGDNNNNNNSNSRRPPITHSSALKRDGDQDQHRRRIPSNTSLSLPSSFENAFQVVVMRVSLHCQGCAGKVKKHLSKMEGVTSFSIDLETKRVTVMGHVSPVVVLESISKVKKAEFWPC